MRTNRIDPANRIRQRAANRPRETPAYLRRQASRMRGRPADLCRQAGLRQAGCYAASGPSASQRGMRQCRLPTLKIRHPRARGGPSEDQKTKQMKQRWSPRLREGGFRF
jgi:hypothetical protein